MTHESAARSPLHAPSRQVPPSTAKGMAGPQNATLSALQKQADESAPVAELQSLADLQRQVDTAPTPRPNNTGLPDNLKAGIESLSGMAMDHVRVHRNSDKPATVQAHAYAQGSDIHLGPGQEKNLPHEAWHVVQQAQGRVKPTMQMKGVAVNDDLSLEAEADVMGANALNQAIPEQAVFASEPLFPNASLQLMKVDGVDTGSTVSGTTMNKHVKATGAQQAAATANFGSSTFVADAALLTTPVDADGHDFPSSTSRSARKDINANVVIYQWTKDAEPGTPGFGAGGAVSRSINGVSTYCEIGAVKTGTNDISITHFKKN